MPEVFWSMVLRAAGSADGAVLCDVSALEFCANAIDTKIKNAENAIEARFIYLSSWDGMVIVNGLADDLRDRFWP